MTNRNWIIGGVVTGVALLIVALLLFLNRDNGDELTIETTSTSTVPTTTTFVVETTTTVGSTTSTRDDSSSSSTVPSSPPTTVPVTSPPGTLPPDPDPDGGQTVDDPVPYQTSIRLDRWQIGVSLADLDATDTILAFVPFNDPPADGSVYVLVELSGVLKGSGVSQPVFDWKLTAPGFEHTPDGLECGVIPNSLYDVGDVQPGGEFKANVCFEVPEEFIGEDLLLSLGLFDASGRERFFALS